MVIITKLCSISGCRSQTGLSQPARIHFNYEQEVHLQENQREHNQWSGENGKEWSLQPPAKPVHC